MVAIIAIRRRWRSLSSVVALHLVPGCSGPIPAHCLAGVESKMKTNLPLVGCRQLTLEFYKEKASVLRYIASAYTDPKLDMEVVVERTGANRYRINEVLKSGLGMTFTSYLNKLRLTEASRLLTEKSSAAVSEIAYFVGYANVPYFNKLFKEEFGSPPTEPLA
jgi:AraC-like DNA-binding protein